MPAYDHQCEICGHEWEDTYSIHDEIPNICPKCKAEGKVKRLISMPAGVKVELQGKELINKLWKEGKDLARRARKDEKLAANLYGTK
jgi:putative FmdB family regulatory protein